MRWIDSFSFCQCALSPLEVSLQIFDFPFELRQPLLGSFVLFALERLLLDFELEDFALHLVDFDRHAVDFNAQPRCRLIDQIDGFVRQKSVADITVRQRRGADDRAVGDAHAVVHFVAFLQAAQDRDGILDRRFVYVNLLEAPFERGVFLDAFAILVQRGRADATQLAAGQRRLEHVRRVHRAFGGAGADQGMQLVDEQNDLAARFGDFFQHGFQSVFELAAKLCAGDQARRDRGQ